MGKSAEGEKNKSHWLICDQAICIETSKGMYAVNAADIAGAEFRGITTIEGIGLTERPSNALPSLKINRFPLVLELFVFLSSGSQQKPEVKICASSEAWNEQIFLDFMPRTDQVVTNDNNWFPLFPDNVLEVRTLMDDVQIEKPGYISTKQAIELLKSDSSVVKLKQGVSNEPTVDYSESHLDKMLNNLAEKGFRAELYDYQKRGFMWLQSIVEEGLGCILADEMGLGKTLQIIALLTYFSEMGNTISLVVAPATLLENWRREFARFSPNLMVHIHLGSERTGFPSRLRGFDVIVTSYDTAVRDQGLLRMIEWDFVIIDEAQAIKNPSTQRAAAMKKLNRKTSIAVTGTPVENKLDDLWSIMDFSCPGILGTHDAFNDIFDDDLDSARKLERIVTPLILRRRVREVAGDLPDRVIIPQAISMYDAEKYEYESIRKETMNQYGQSSGLVSLLRLRQYCTHRALLDIQLCQPSIPLLSSAKYARLLEILEEIFDNQEKVLLFTSFQKMLDIIASDIPRRFNVPALKIDGRTPIVERQPLVDQLAGEPGPAVLALNPKAAGTGLNITAANHVIHYNLEWNPAVEDQATARAFRRGQQLPVTVHRLFYPYTVEEIINERLERKRDLADTAVVGTTGSQFDSADIARAIHLSPIAKQVEAGI